MGSKQRLLGSGLRDEFRLAGLNTPASFVVFSEDPVSDRSQSVGQVDI